MIYVGIDVSKDKHDCCIISSDGEILVDSFSIPNSKVGFEELHKTISSFSSDLSNIKVGLEATGHYSYNILGFLLNKGFITYVINPLYTNLHRKGHSLRKTKTDKIDSQVIATLLMTDPSLKPYSPESYHILELKSLCRYRYKKVQERAKLKISVSRLINILFPELEKIVSTIHGKAIYALLKLFPGASKIASASLEEISLLLAKNSKNRYKRDFAMKLYSVAQCSIGSEIISKSLELSHTISLIEIMDSEILEIESRIKEIMDSIDSLILTIPGISYRMGAMIISEIGDFKNFNSPDKILAFSGISPSTYQSGHFVASNAHMEKRGSKYLRFALFNAAIYASHWDSNFKAYLEKKRKQGKHYYVAITHVVKKLVRVIFHLVKTNQKYQNILQN